MDLIFAQAIIHDVGIISSLHQDELLHLLDFSQVITSYCHYILPENHLKYFPRKTYSMLVWVAS